MSRSSGNEVRVPIMRAVKDIQMVNQTGNFSKERLRRVKSAGFRIPKDAKVKTAENIFKTRNFSFFFYDYETRQLLAAPIYFREDMGIEETADGVNFHCGK
ncbi:hypothetical protein STEG23_026798, partial [Scotinomys teguina]